MKPVPQRICAAGGDGILPGDCVKCCVASILELPYEDVPHFVNREVRDADGRQLDWEQGINHWLRERGYPLHYLIHRHCKTSAEVFEERAKFGLEPGVSMPAISMYNASKFPDRLKGYWIASVISENFEDSTHAIVMHDREVAFDPSTKPRRTPYQFIGWGAFVALDPARCAPCSGDM